MAKRSILSMGVVFLLIVMSVSAWAVVPTSMNYQGKLTDSDGKPLTGSYNLTFYLFTAPSSGSAIWSENHTDVAVTDGIYNVILGSTNPLATGLFIDNDQLYLEVEVDGETLAPRQQLTSAPYALKARVADAVVDGAITTVMIEDGAVDSQKIGNDSVTGTKIADGTVSYVDIQDGSTLAEIKDDDGAGSGLDADMLDGLQASDFVRPSADYGRYGVTSNLYEGTTTLSNRYINDDSADTMQASTTLNLFSAIQNGTGRAIYAESAGVKGIEGQATGTNGAGVAGYCYATNGSGVVGQGSKKGVYGYSSSPDAYGVHGEATGTNSYAGYFSGRLYTSGNVGIGTTTLDHKLHVAGNAKFDVGGGSIAVTTPGGWPGVIAYSQNGHRRDIQYYNDFMAITMSDSSDAPPYTNGIRIYENGNVAVKVIQITGGSDLSEQFDIRGPKEGLVPAPGMVVSIDPAKPGDLVISQESYDKRVAGVISGAGGVKPGMLMRQKGSEADGANPVALTGRVYCWADASQGSIVPGDLLTTSDTPGHAMKATDYAKAQGAILGKAMTRLASGKGLVLILVTLQ